MSSEDAHLCLDNANDASAPVHRELEEDVLLVELDHRASHLLGLVSHTGTLSVSASVRTDRGCDGFGCRDGFWLELGLRGLLGRLVKGYVVSVDLDHVLDPILVV